MYIRVHIKASIQILQHLRQNGQRTTGENDEGRCQDCEKGCKDRKERGGKAEEHEEHEEIVQGDEGQANLIVKK